MKQSVVGSIPTPGTKSWDFMSLKWPFFDFLNDSPERRAFGGVVKRKLSICLVTYNIKFINANMSNLKKRVRLPPPPLPSLGTIAM